MNETDLLLINRSGRDYALPATEIEALTDDADLLVVNRDGVDYKVSAKDLKDYLNPSLPWEGHDGGIWHITFAGGYNFNLPYPCTAWDIDGTNERVITWLDGDKPEELVFVTPPDCTKLFEAGRVTEFGPLTDTSKVTVMDYMFNQCYQVTDNSGGWDVSNVTSMINMFYEGGDVKLNTTNWDTSNVISMSGMFTLFNVSNLDITQLDTSSVTSMFAMFSNSSGNPDISGWDVSNVTNMANMFLGAKDFNQDLSDWCVSEITSEPTGFATGAIRWREDKPVWGTCPRGEDNKP